MKTHFKPSLASFSMPILFALFWGSSTCRAQAPVVPPNSVVNNAGYTFGANGVAPGSIAAIFGSNLTNGTSCLHFQGCDQTLDPATNLLRTTLSGAQVTVNGAPVPVFYASPGQLGIQMPTNLTGTSATVQVTVNGQTSPPQTVAVSPFAPGIFAINSQGTGQGAVQFANKNIFASPNIAGQQTQRAGPGDFLTIYCTGLGQVSPAVATGALPGANPPSTTVTKPQVTIGGVDAPVSFAGLVPGNAGFYQVNVQIPAGVPHGWTVPVSLTIGGIRSNTVTIAVHADDTGHDDPTVFVGNATSVTGYLYGEDFFGGSAGSAGSVTLTGNGTTSGNQTVYSVAGTGGGTVPCPGSNGSSTTGNWTATVTATTTVSPAVSSLIANGGTVTGMFTYSLTLNACGSTQSQNGGGTVNGTVNPGGTIVANLFSTS